MGTVSRLDLGAYEARRAAALSGVPLSTVYDWAHKGVVVPSVSQSRTKLWSYGDLLTLRLVRWLRSEKAEARRTAMTEVREALHAFGDELWEESSPGHDRPSIVVDAAGRVIHRQRNETASGQRVFDEALDLFAPFQMDPDTKGPDLRTPDVHLRIAPGRCAGEPHLVGTRLTTRTLAALADRGYELDTILQLYPRENPTAVAEALELEASLVGAAA